MRYPRRPLPEHFNLITEVALSVINQFIPEYTKPPRIGKWATYWRVKYWTRSEITEQIVGEINANLLLARLPAVAIVDNDIAVKRVALNIPFQI